MQTIDRGKYQECASFFLNKIAKKANEAGVSLRPGYPKLDDGNLAMITTEHKITIATSNNQRDIHISHMDFINKRWDYEIVARVDDAIKHLLGKS